MARFLITRWSAKDLLQWESAIYHSIKLGFEGQVAKKFLNGIYLTLSLKFDQISQAILCIYARNWIFILAFQGRRSNFEISIPKKIIFLEWLLLKGALSEVPGECAIGFPMVFLFQALKFQFEIQLVYKRDIMQLLLRTLQYF